MPNVPFPNLFLSTKVKPSINVPNGPSLDEKLRSITIALREIERWANGSGVNVPITGVISSDSTVTVTDPTGPVVDLSIAGSSSGGYLSLTGPGQTATPGQLNQAGPFIATSNGCEVGVDVAIGPLTNNVIINAANELSITAPGFVLSTNEGTFTTSGLGFEFSPLASFTVYMHGGLVVQQSMAVQYGVAGAGATATPGITLEDLGTSTTVGLYVYPGNPNTHISPGSTAHAFCFDTATPKLWGWNGTAWV